VRDLARLPKVDLHVHLESTIRPDTVLDLASRAGVAVPPAPGGFTGFGAFAERGRAVRALLRHPDDFHRIAAEFAADQAADGVGYVEVTFTAASHGDRLGDPAAPLEAVLAGLAGSGLPFGVLLDHPRKRPAARFAHTLALARRYADAGVVGIGLAGAEEHPVAPFASVCADAGVHLVHHAGETCGPESVWEALTLGRAERIGHGIRALEDPALVAELRDRAIPLEVCPTSNVALGLVSSPAEHPLPRMLAAGLTVTIGTDIPDVTGRTLTSELAALRDVLGFDDAALARLNHTAVDASFAPADLKSALHRATDDWLGPGTP
jgi:adenosine deaminase